MKIKQYQYGRVLSHPTIIISSQNPLFGSELIVLKADDEHLSRIPFDSRHKSSLKSLAVIQVLKSFKFIGQNSARISCLGEPSSSLPKLNLDRQFINRERNSTYITILSSTRVDFFLEPPNMWHIYSIGIFT